MCMYILYMHVPHFNKYILLYDTHSFCAQVVDLTFEDCSVPWTRCDVLIGYTEVRRVVSINELIVIYGRNLATADRD